MAIFHVICLMNLMTCVMYCGGIYFKNNTGELSVEYNTPINNLSDISSEYLSQTTEEENEDMPEIDHTGVHIAAFKWEENSLPIIATMFILIAGFIQLGNVQL